MVTEVEGSGIEAFRFSETAIWRRGSTWMRFSPLGNERERAV
jgi:hypothetical protein